MPMSPSDSTKFAQVEVDRKHTTPPMNSATSTHANRGFYNRHSYVSGDLTVSPLTVVTAVYFKALH